MQNRKPLSQSSGRGRDDGPKLARPRNTGSARDLASLAEVGFVGLGRMGKAMAINLVAAGFKVMAYIRRPERAGELSALGLSPTTDIRDLFGCAIVVTMVTDDQAVHDLSFGNQELGVPGLAVGLMPGAIHLSMS